MTKNQRSKSLLSEIKEDLQRYYRIETNTDSPSFSLKVRTLLYAYGLHAIAVHRIGQYIQNIECGTAIRRLLLVVQRCIRTCIRRLYGIHISPEATLGPGLYIGHLGGIRIEKCRIGAMCSVHQHTSIEDQAVIGNRVWMGGHSFIKKGVCIGDGATISTGTYVMNDIKGRALVMGNPGRIILREYDNTKMLALDDEETGTR